MRLVAREAAEPAAVEALVVRGPRRIPAPPFDALHTLATPDRTRVDLELLAIRDSDAWRAATGSATLLVDGHLLGVSAGDRVRVFGQLASVRQPANRGEFDFARHARAERCLCWLRSEFPDCITLAASGSAWSWPRLLGFLHATGDRLLYGALASRRAGLASAMFLGSREELEPDQTQAFLQTGTIHLLVISGLNVGILAGCLFLLMRAGLVPRPWALALVAVATVLYAATTSAQPPVVRSTVMVLIVCASMILGRAAVRFNSIAAAGLVVLALNPSELFQVGTQLSFLSVAALAWLAERHRAAGRHVDPLDRLIARTRPWAERLARAAGRGVWRASVASFII